MTCSECQVQIFDGELDRDAVVHLTTCGDCRVLDREVRLNATALASMREDVMPVRRPWRWPWMVAVAAAAAVAVFGLSHRSTPVAVPEKMAVIRPEPAAPVLLKPAPVKPAPTPVRRARPARPALPAEPLLVKFLTDDPDVVIYWLIDPVQGEQAL